MVEHNRHFKRLYKKQLLRQTLEVRITMASMDPHNVRSAGMDPHSSILEVWIPTGRSLQYAFTRAWPYKDRPP